MFRLEDRLCSLVAFGMPRPIDWLCPLVIFGFCFIIFRAAVIDIRAAYKRSRDHQIATRFSLRQVLVILTALCISAAFAQIHVAIAGGGFFITLSSLLGYLLAGRIGCWNAFCVSFSAVGIAIVLAVLHR